MRKKCKRRHRQSFWKAIQSPASNEIFDAKPDEILALRKAVRWSRVALAQILYVHINEKRKDSETIRRWERGLTRPHRLHRCRMLFLVEKFRDEYLQILQKTRREKAATRQSNLASEVGFLRNSDIPLSQK